MGSLPLAINCNSCRWKITSLRFDEKFSIESSTSFQSLTFHHEITSKSILK